MPFHSAHLPLKTQTKDKGRQVVHMYQHDENTEACSQMHTLTTLSLSTYSHSHYSDEPNKEMHKKFIFKSHRLSTNYLQK